MIPLRMFVNINYFEMYFSSLPGLVQPAGLCYFVKKIGEERALLSLALWRCEQGVRVGAVHPTSSRAVVLRATECKEMMT